MPKSSLAGPRRVIYQTTQPTRVAASHPLHEYRTRVNHDIHPQHMHISQSHQSMRPQGSPDAKPWHARITICLRELATWKCFSKKTAKLLHTTKIWTFFFLLWSGQHAVVAFFSWKCFHTMSTALWQLSSSTVFNASLIRLWIELRIFFQTGNSISYTLDGIQDEDDRPLLPRRSSSEQNLSYPGFIFLPITVPCVAREFFLHIQPSPLGPCKIQAGWRRSLPLRLCMQSQCHVSHWHNISLFFRSRVQRILSALLEGSFSVDLGLRCRGNWKLSDAPVRYIHQTIPERF